MAVRETAAGLLVAICALVTAVAADETVTLTASAAIERALEHNESIGMADAEALGAAAAVRENRADGLPDLSARFGYTRNWLLPSIFFNDAAVKIGSDNELVGTLQLRQPLYTGGDVGGSVQAARQRALAAEQAARRQRQAVTALVERALYDLLLADEMVRVRQLALDRARSNRDQVVALGVAGRATRFERTRAEAQVVTAVADSIDSASERARRLMELKERVGLPLASTVVVDAGFQRTSPLAPDTGMRLADLIERAMGEHPDLRQLQALAESYDGESQAARAGTRPRVDLVAVGQAQHQADDFGGVSDGDQWRRSWSTGLTLEVPLFDGLRTRARVARARQARRRADLELEQVQRLVERQVRQAWLDVGAAGERLRARSGLGGPAETGLDDAEARYRNGAGTQLEVLDAQLSLLQARTEEARARRDRAVALVSLEQAVGVLGETAADGSP
jgi:outer membrane protein